MASKDKVAAARQAAQAQVKARERRALVVWIVVGVAIVGLFAALIAYIVRQGEVGGDLGAGGEGTPTVSTADGAIPVGAKGVAGQDLDESRARLDVYFDFMCPYCRIFEESQGATLEQLQADGVVDVYYHPLNFLDRLSRGSQYSTRAGSAAALVAEEQPEAFIPFMRLMFANQPAENTSGLSDDQIVEIAKAAGVSDEIAERIPDYEYATWMRQATERASKDGVGFTPQLAINGVLQDPQSDPNAVSWTVEGALRDALIAAQKDNAGAQ